MQFPWGTCPSHDSKPDRGGRDCAPAGTRSPSATATSPSLVPTAPTATSHRQRVPVRVWDPLPTVPRGHRMGRTVPVLNVSPPPTPAPERQVLVPARWEQGGCCTMRHGERGWSPWMLGGHASHGEGEEGSSCLLQQCRGGGCSGVKGGHSNYRAQTGLGGTGQDQLLLIPAHPSSSRACFNATGSSTSALPVRSRGSCPAATRGRGLTRSQSQPRLRRCRCSAGPRHCTRKGGPALTRPTNSSGCGRSTAAPPARPGHRSCKRVSSSSGRRRLSRPPSWVPPWWASPA